MRVHFDNVKRSCKGDYGIISGSIVVGGIVKNFAGSTSYVAFDGSVGPLGEPCRTLKEAKTQAEKWYEYRDYCHGGCGDIIYKADYCPACLQDMRRGLGQ